MAIQRACRKPYTGNYTPRSSLVGSVIVVLGRATDQDWHMDQELRGWRPRDDSAVLTDVLDEGGNDHADV